MSVFVICHDSPPAFKLPEEAKIVWLNKTPFSGNSHSEVINGYDYFENPEDVHDKLSGAMGSIAISRYLLEIREKPSHVTIWQYRKFVSRNTYGKAAPNYGGMFLVNEEDAAKIHLEVDLKDSVNYTIPNPVKIENLLHQYSLCHILSDFLKYTCCLIDVNVVDQKEVASFFDSQYLIPGGIELGTYPTDWWLKTMESIAKAAFYFMENYTVFDPYEPHRKRALAFCQERIGSYLLIKHLEESQAPSTPSSYLGIILSLRRRGRDLKPSVPLSYLGTMHTVTNLGMYTAGV